MKRGCFGGPHKADMALDMWVLLAISSKTTPKTDKGVKRTDLIVGGGWILGFGFQGEKSDFGKS